MPEEFGILLRALPDKSIYVETKFLSGGKDIGRHKLDAFSKEADLRYGPQQRINIVEEQRKVIADFNEEMGHLGASMGMKEVDSMKPPKSPTDDQSICEPEQSRALPGECGENLLGRPPSLEGERPPVEQPGPDLGDADHARGESGGKLVWASDIPGNISSDPNVTSFKLAKPVPEPERRELVVTNLTGTVGFVKQFFTESVPQFPRYELRDGECVDVSIGSGGRTGSLPSADDSPKPVDGPDNSAECGATGRTKGNRAARQDKKPPRKA